MSTREEIRAQRVAKAREEAAARRAAILEERREAQLEAREEAEAERAAVLEERREAQLEAREARVLAKGASDHELLRRRILAPVEEVPGLPRVLLIGDSVSMGYTLRVRDILEDEANVQRIPANGDSSTQGLANIDSWLGTTHWDLIHFNFGIHDAKLDESGVAQTTLAQYAHNLRALVSRLLETGAKLIFATTTPTPSPSDRYGDSAPYNAVAVPIMQQNSVAIDDLYSAMLPHFASWAEPNDVHFKSAGDHFLASRVAHSIADAL